MKTKNLKNEMFNFKDEEGQKSYKEMTSGNELTSIFQNSNIVDPAKRWHKEFQNSLQRSFQKIRVKGPKPPNKDVMNKILEKLDELKTGKADDQTVLNESEYKEYFELTDQLETVEEEIGNTSAENNAKMILEHFGILAICEGGFSLSKMWGLKKKVRPKVSADLPTAMMDSQKNLITN